MSGTVQPVRPDRRSQPTGATRRGHRRGAAANSRLRRRTACVRRRACPGGAFGGPCRVASQDLHFVLHHEREAKPLWMSPSQNSSGEFLKIRTHFASIYSVPAFGATHYAE